MTMVEDATMVVVVALAALPLWLLWCRSVRLWGKKLPPGSLGWPLIGETLQLRRCLLAGDADIFCHQRRRQHGSVYKTHLFGSPCVMVSGADAVKLLATSEDSLVESHQLLSIRKLLGKESIVNVVGQKHKLFRRVLNDKFMGDELKKFLGRVEAVALDQVSAWQPGEVRTMEEEATHFTYNIIVGLTVSWGRGHPSREPSLELAKAMAGSLMEVPLEWPGFPFRRGMRARRSLDRMFATEVRLRRSGQIVRNDLLAEMMKATDDSSQILFTDEQLKDNLHTLVMGGHDTSTNILTWIAKLLSDNPHCYHRLLEEHEEIRRSKVAGEPLQWEDVKKMTYTTTVIQEALRISSIVFFFQRRVKQDFKLSGYDIPKGWIVVVDTHDLHHDVHNYPSPIAFDPTRFDKRPKPHSYMPFGVGPRMCLGKDMAMLQMCVFLHHMVLNCKWTLTHNDNLREYRGGPHIKNGVPFRVDTVTKTTYL